MDGRRLAAHAPLKAAIADAVSRGIWQTHSLISLNAEVFRINARVNAALTGVWATGRRPTVSGGDSDEPRLMEEMRERACALGPPGSSLAVLCHLIGIQEIGSLVVRGIIPNGTDEPGWNLAVPGLACPDDSQFLQFPL